MSKHPNSPKLTRRQSRTVLALAAVVASLTAVLVVVSALSPTGARARRTASPGADPTELAAPAGGGDQAVPPGQPTPTGDRVAGGSANQPPTIESVEFSGTKSLTVVARPSVSDPDGDRVDVQVFVDGTPADPLDGGAFRRSLERGEVPVEHDAEVRVVATDEHGSVTEHSETRPLIALDRVTVGSVRVSRSGFGCRSQMAFDAAVLVRGPLVEDHPVTGNLTSADPSVALTPVTSVEVPTVERTPVRVFADIVIDGELFSHQGTVEDTDTVSETQTVGTCNRTVSYAVTVEAI